MTTKADDASTTTSSSDNKEEAVSTSTTSEVSETAASTEHADSADTDIDELAQAVGKIHVGEVPADESKAAVEEEEEEEEEVPKALQKLASWIIDGTVKNILVLSGAGVSVSAGIPDFRTPGTGLYDNLKKYNLPYPEAVFDIDFYQRNPIPFCSLAAEIWPGLKHKPTLTHSFVGLLASRDLLLRNYSQNIDGLEYLADIPAEKLVECHGHFRTASCVQCRKAADGQAVKETIVQHAKAPVCKHCTGYVKPDIVFFGEGLPHKFHNSLKKDLRVADMVLILGTSLNVAPVSMIPEMVEGNCKRVLLNRELVGDLDLDDSDRDLFYAGDCDDAIQKLADLLDWREDLQEWHARVQGSIHPGADASD